MIPTGALDRCFEAASNGVAITEIGQGLVKKSKVWRWEGRGGGGKTADDLEDRTQNP